MSKESINNPSGSWRLILLLIITGAAVLMISPVSADAGVTISANGDQSYYYGEDVILHGNNSISETTYLFVTGPNLPSGGVKLTFPHAEVASGNPGTFTVVKTKPDKTWEYTYYTANLMMDAGVFNIYATSQPTTNDLEATSTSSQVSIVLKRPFIMAEISPATVTKGQPFTVKGTAEGNPPDVQLWILGNNFFSIITIPVDIEANYTFTADAPFSRNLAAGDYYLIVQHSMADNQFAIAFNGEYVTAMERGNSTLLFKVKGPGSLQGRDAAEALVFALNKNELGDDTYVIVPFTVDETGYSPQQAHRDATAPVQQGNSSPPFQLTSSGITV
ncbi:MAG: hypothetical protein Q7T80_04880, partial [Methanoregula sp.]|nr:hypothetical protein [Methanoregula sp.]